MELTFNGLKILDGGRELVGGAVVAARPWVGWNSREESLRRIWEGLANGGISVSKFGVSEAKILDMAKDVEAVFPKQKPRRNLADAICVCAFLQSESIETALVQKGIEKIDARITARVACGLWIQEEVGIQEKFPRRSQQRVSATVFRVLDNITANPRVIKS